MVAQGMSAFRRPFSNFLRSHKIEAIVTVLLVVNAFFLYAIWKKKDSQFLPATHLHSADSNYTSLTKEIQHMIRVVTNSGFPKDSLLVDVYLTDRQCPTCIDEALPYWLAIDGNAKLTIHFVSRSTSPRQTERFSQQYGIPMKWIKTVSSVNPADSLLWNSTAPSVVLRKKVDGTIVLVHIGDSAERKRATVFYATLTRFIQG